MAELHVVEADKNAVGHGAAPHRRVGERAEAELVEVRLHVEQQTAAGDEVDLKDVVRERSDRRDVFSVQTHSPFLSALWADR